MEIRADIQTRAERRAAPLGAMQAVRKALVSMPGKLLGLSIGFVLLAEILIFFPSAANYRSDWLTERTDDAYLASLAVETADEMVKADRKRDAERAAAARQKKAQEARKKHKTIEIKELKFRPNIDDNDYNVKMKHAVKFLTEGDKVKITMRFRGREVTHQDLGMRVLMRVSGDLAELGKVEQRPTLEGRQMTMVLAPLVQPGEKAEGADKAAEKA